MVSKITEADFVERLEALYKIKSNDYVTKREVPSKHGIADLVAIKTNSINTRLRLKHGQKTRLLNENYFKILKYIPDIDSQKKPADINYIVQKTNLTRSYVQSNLLDFLEEHGYVISQDKKYYKIDGWVPIADEVIAIEAKLHDWRQGLLQANRYKSFANKVYLAVPPKTAARVDRDLLEKFDIGLISFDPESKVFKQSYVRARKRKGINQDRINYVTEFVLSQ